MRISIFVVVVLSMSTGTRKTILLPGYNYFDESLFCSWFCNSESETVSKRCLQ